MRFVSKTKECFAYNTKIIETPTTKEVYIYENPIFIHSKEKVDLTDTSNRKKFDEMSAHKQYDSLKRKQKHYEQARWDIARIVDCNFDNKTKFVTLTFKENIQEILITNREFKYFIQRLNYYLYHTKTQLLKYLATWEKQKRGAIHYHVIFFDFPYIAKEKLQNLWSHGFIKINRIDVDSKENRGRYLSKYFGKDLDLKEHKKKAFFKSQAKELNPNGIYVFEPNGEIMTTDSFNRRLKKYCKEAGVPYHSSHKIRFYNASTAFDGNNLTTLSYLMGHSETATTLHYLRNVNKRKNDRLAFQNLGISS